MSINYTWSFNLDVLPSQDGLSDVVTKVNWIYTGSDSTTDAYIDALIGSFTLPAPLANTFIPIVQLTNETVRGWVEEIIGPNNLANMQSHIASSANNITYPVVLTL